MKRTNSKSISSSLRQKAEEFLKRKGYKTNSEYSEGDTLKLSHESEVHQVELEMQNNELMLAKEHAEHNVEKYAELYDFAPCGYFTLSKEGTIIEMNLTGAKMLGKERVHLVNRQLGTFLSSNTLTTFNHFLNKIFNSKVNEFCEVAIETNTNLLRYVYLTGIASADQEQCLVNMVDISDQKKEQDDILKLKRAVENSGEAIFITDLNGLITYINPEFTNIYGYSSTEVVGKVTPRILKSGVMNEDNYKYFWSSLLNKQVIKGELINKTKDGRLVNIEGSANPILNDSNQIIGFIAIQRDITERKENEFTLKESEEKFRTLFEKASDGIFIMNLNKEIVLTNESFAHMHGYTLQEMENLNLSILDDTPETIEKFEDRINRILSGETLRFEVEHHHKLGNMISLEVITSQITYNKEKFVIAFHRDITQRKQTERILIENEKKHRSLVENVGEGIGLVNRKEIFLYANPAAENIFGVGDGELVGRSLKDFLSEEQYLTILNQTEIRKEGQSSIYEIEITTHNGNKKNMLVTAVPQFDDDEFTGTFGIFRDITMVKQYEKQLLQLNDDKDRFISILSHDLRSPFGAILGITDLLSNNIRKYDINKIENLCNHLNKSAKSTYELLEDVLFWARAQSGKIPFEPTNIHCTDICKSIFELLSPIANQKNITINFLTEDETIFADENMLKTVLRNLVSNAIKFTNQGGHIDIYSERASGFIIITVSDNGIGLNSDVIENLFNVSRLHSTDGTFGEKGTGFGLLLCKEFVEKHGGRIWVESVEGKGSKFKFSIPTQTV